MSDLAEVDVKIESVGRREFLQRGALTGAGAAAVLLGGAGCKDIRDHARSLTGPAPAQWTALPHNADAVTRAAHVLNRVAYGPRPGDVAHVAQIGRDGVCRGTTGRQNGRRPRGNVARQRPGHAADRAGHAGHADSYDDGEVLTQTAQAALLRAVYSRHQLREVLADFWTNHFNIYALKNDGRSLLPTDTEHVLRPHALGTFRELLTHRPRTAPPCSAIWTTTRTGAQNGSENANENYARELLELHTLGVKSGYTQRDIQEVARCFTGWTVHKGWVALSLANMSKPYNSFEYDPKGHDEGAKYIPFLNLTISANGGERDARNRSGAACHAPGNRAFHCPQTVPPFSGDAHRRDCGESGNRLPEQRKRHSRHAAPHSAGRPGRSRAVQQPILKRPLDYVAGSLRALAADTDGGGNCKSILGDMGQPLYQWPMPDGFPEKTSAWAGSLLPRWNYALALAANKIGGTSVDLHAPLQAAKATSDAAMTDTLLETVYGRPHDAPELAQTRQQISGAYRTRPKRRRKRAYFTGRNRRPATGRPGLSVEVKIER